VCCCDGENVIRIRGCDAMPNWRGWQCKIPVRHTSRLPREALTLEVRIATRRRLRGSRLLQLISCILPLFRSSLPLFPLLFILFPAPLHPLSRSSLSSFLPASALFLGPCVVRLSECSRLDATATQEHLNTQRRYPPRPPRSQP
jgi:hypothetical protein